MVTQRPTWWPQPVAPEGYSDSEGIKRQLGSLRLDPLTVLVREAGQNSCDAALPHDSDIDFSIRIQSLTAQQRNVWTDFLLPETHGAGLGIKAALTNSPTMVMVSDRGTTGLGGVLRSDESPLPGERKDFVNFIRNVGANKTLELSGGSYGFGKGIFYSLSRCHAIVADSVCKFRGTRQRRLMGAALGRPYDHGGHLFTGRHWLGGIDSDGYSTPLLDQVATETAEALGLPGFERGETGTTVVIVAADLGCDGDVPRDPESAAAFIASSVLWHLWPRMLYGRKSRLVPTVWLNGDPIAMPEPERLPELWPFVDAYRKVLEEDRSESPVRRQRPQHIGRFALSQGMAPVWDDELLARAAPFEGRAHHCVRMRQADLVVDYFPGEPIPNERVQYGGVFRASVEADEYFAAAEPPTHDDWILNGLSGTARGVVQLASGFIREKLRSVTSVTDDEPASTTSPLGHFSNRLSRLIITACGDSAAANSGKKGGSSGETNQSTSRGPKLVDGPSLVEEAGRPVIRALVEVPVEARGSTAQIVAKVVLDGEKGVDGLGDLEPKILGWTSVATGRRIRGDSLSMAEADGDRRWIIRVRPVPDTVTRVAVRLAKGGDR